MAKFLRPIIRFRASLTSKTSHSTNPLFGNFQCLKTWMNQPPALYIRPPCSYWKLFVQRYFRMPNLCDSGCKFSIGSIFGVSVVLGSINLWPHIAYSMDGIDILVDDNQVDLLGASNFEEDPPTFLIFARKLMVPIFLFSTVWMNWGHPIILLAKVILILLSTKPSPFSVYIFVEQLRRQSMRQHPLLYKFKSLYAKKVDVEDYTFLCVARVELKDQKFTLIGILGSWWVFQLTPCQGAFSALRNSALKNYIRN